MQVISSGRLLPPYVTIDSWMPRHDDAGLVKMKSTMKSDPGRPESVPCGADTLCVAYSSCAPAVDGRVAAGRAGSTSVAAFPPRVAETAVAAPVIATPARNLRRLTSVRELFLAMTSLLIRQVSADYRATRGKEKPLRGQRRSPKRRKYGSFQCSPIL